MIPKIIHFCWFGGNELTEDAKQCIDSWRKYCPQYQIIKWDESNFDINCCKYVNDAYKERKWAFVSDYARFFILYNYGGIYMDTDVELIKNLDDLIECGSFMGWEDNEGLEEGPYVAPGLIMASEANSCLYKDIMDYYKNLNFYNEDGSFNKETVVTITTRKLVECGLVLDKSKQYIANYTIYPPEYFCPMNKLTGKVSINKNTYSIHKYSASWKSNKTITKEKIQKLLGSKMTNKIIKIKKRVLGKGNGAI